MGWSLSEPSRPFGSEWVKKASFSYININNNIDMSGTIYCARLDDNGFAIWIEEWRNTHPTNPEYIDFYRTYHRCDIGNTQGTPYEEEADASRFQGGKTINYYFTGQADPGVSITVKIGVKADNPYVMQTKTFTAPEFLGPKVYIRISNQWKQGKIKINVGGSWKEARLRYKNNSTWE